MSVYVFNEENFEGEALKSNETVIVDFYADWCGPCKVMSPIIDEIAEELESVKVGKVNVDESGEIAMRYDISSIPTIMVFKNGEPIKTFVGVTDKEIIKEAVK